MEKLFKVVIMGRPNTGKSTLFNLIAKKQTAITDQIPGVTRDHVKAICKFNDKTFRLLDSGGLFNDTEDELNMLVHNKSLDALKDADLVIFLCDIRELSPIDQEIARTLHKFGKHKVFLVLNKADNLPKKEYESESSEFYSFGFERFYMISAAHGLGVNDLLIDITEKISDQPVIIEEEPIRVGIVGKPNVGKSSLLNRLAGENISIVYDKPGTTRDPVDVEIQFNNKKLVFIDTAGIRKKNKVTEDIEYYSVNRAIKTIRHSDVTILVIDAKEGVTEQDKKIVSLVMEAGKGLLIAVNKWDLIDKTAKPFHEYTADIRDEVQHLKNIPILTMSALTGMRARKTLDYAVEIYESNNRRIDTATVNKFIQELQIEHDIAAHLKIYYGVQVRTSPPVFQFFVNNEKYLKENKKTFILYTISEKFGLSGVFPVLQIKSKKGRRK